MQQAGAPRGADVMEHRRSQLIRRCSFLIIYEPEFFNTIAAHSGRSSAERTSDSVSRWRPKTMMGPQQVDQAALFYEFSLERHVPATPLPRSIDRQAGSINSLILLICFQDKGLKATWCPGAGSNHRHCDFQSHALPTELPGQVPGRGARLGSAGL
jgi:hypothetical protein